MIVIFFIWLVDVLNVPGSEFLDTTLQLNTKFWFIFWILAIIISALSLDDKEKK